MANHVSAKKRAAQNVKRAKVNSAGRSKIRTFVKKVELALIAGDFEAAQAALKEAQPILQKGAAKGIVEKKAVARKISRLSARIKTSKSAPAKEATAAKPAKKTATKAAPKTAKPKTK